MTDESEDVVSKYKRLLAMARSSLESNQATIALKDKQITQLMAALEEEKSSKSKKPNVKDTDETGSHPRTLLRRVDVDTTIWLLVEYDASEDAWISFKNESELDEFIQRVSGVPLTKPSKCLTVQESANVQNEAKLKIDQITEEFRRYVCLLILRLF